MPYSRILIAIDDSPESMKAARCGFELAHALKATVAIVYVIDKDKQVINADLGITPAESEQALRSEANQTIEQFIRMFDGVAEVFRFTPDGEPEKEILGIAAEWKADLIVMGTHGRSGLDKMLTGSVAEYVIRHSEIPVLVSPSKMK